MSVVWSRVILSIGLLHIVACEDKDTGLPDIDNDGVIDSEDCDAQNAAINASATDTVGDDIDQNCDGIDGTDGDGDGVASVASGGTDCDDDNPEEEASAETVFYADKDGDGYGDVETTASSCEMPLGYVDNADDCDDESSAVNPDASEVCDGIDNDCDELVDDDDDAVEGLYTTYTDADGDGYGDSASELSSCAVPETNIEVGGDCDDTDASINPDAEESIADGVDSDCDGLELCFVDADEDGFGADLSVELSDDGTGAFDCDSNVGMSSNSLDCEDGDSAVHPSASEICDSIDNDCDDLVDDADDSVDLTTGGSYFLDNDGDGYGLGSVMACDQAGNMVLVDGDCDDALVTSNPMATDIVGDTVDQNCDGVDGTDFDGDGYASSISGGVDCNDQDAAINPDAQEVCSGIDEDCDGLLDDEDDSIDLSATVLLYLDADGDGYGDAGTEFNSCGNAVGYVSDATDCDDTDAMTYPGAAYAQSTIDCLTDADGDGWGMIDVAGDTCYTIEMFDDYGDGWNGGQIEIFEDGTLADTVTLLSGSDGSEEYCGIEGSTIEFYFVEGSYTYEIGYTILDPNGIEMVSVLPGGAAETGLPTASGTVVTSIGYGDCDDSDASINPDSTESCDGFDNNCNGQVDEGLLQTYFIDNDGDGFGDGEVESCSQPSMTALVDGDCDDTDAAVNSNAVEVCDLMDNNCDGTIDEGVTSTFFIDADADGFGDSNQTIEACSESQGTATIDGDCDDSSSSAFPGSAELESTTDCMEDTDGDGYGNSNVQSPVVAGEDCQDTLSGVNPMATDIAGDSIDQNCDGVDGTDFDGDGDPSVISGGTDCDDMDSTVENLDVDGDGSSTCDSDCDDNDVNTVGDDDGDGFYACEDDCDDADISVNPDANEIWYDGIDQDCDGSNDFDQDMDGEESIDYGGVDCDDFNPDINTSDDDGDGFSSCEGDCWDNSADDDGDGVIDSSRTYPGAAFSESLTECLTDEDGDGYAPVLDGTLCYTFETYDAYGDGWEGNGIDIYEEGILVDTIANEDLDGAVNNTTGGETNSHEYCVGSMTNHVDLVFVDGAYNSEIEFEFYSPYGELIIGGYGEGTSDLVINGETFVDGDTIYAFDVMGLDCDDTDANVYDGSDNDGDGYGACDTDCDDYDPGINDGATEIWYDGVDQDCDNASDYDQDMDGDDDVAYGGTDCDDTDSSVEGLDVDGDGESTCDGDCDDSDLAINSSATEVYYDGVDQDCDGMSDYDQDGDGYEGVDYGGEDCDDTDSSTYGDDDGDGYLDCVDDCDDGDSTSNPGGTEVCGDGIDQDCDGSDLVCYTPLSNTVTWNGHVYASIDDHSPYDGGVYCQNNYVSLPNGWEVAPYVAGIESMINSYGWGTHCMILANSASYGTSNYSYGNCGSGVLDQSGNSYRANSCSRRVLIRRSE